MSDEAKRGDVIGVVGSDRYREWTYERRRPGVPVLGILLLTLGGILLVNQLAPGAVNLVFSIAGLAIGLGFLYAWFRGGWGLYPGILFVALSLPGLLIGLGALPQRDGYSTLLLGAGLLAVALVRLRDRRGFGWQGLLGLVLALVGGAAIAGDIGVGAFIWAAVLIGAGIAIIFRR
jgi:hypothetical protein